MRHPWSSADKVFVVCCDEASAKRMVVCLKTADGSVAWQRDYSSESFRKNRDNSFASSTPAVDREHLYVYWTTPEEVTLLALDHQGKEAWRRNLGPFKSQHGSGTSPIVFNDLIIVSNDQKGPSFLIALDARTGATRWQIERRTTWAAYATPCVRETAEGAPELVFASSSHGLSGIDRRAGKVNWEFTNAFPFRVVSSPVIAGGLVIGTCGEGGVGRRLVAVRPGSAKQPPQLAYEMKSGLPYVPTPLVKDGLLFLWGDNGLVACHRAATGERIWQEKISDSFYCSPVWANGRLYGVSKKGVVYLLAAAEEYKLLSSISLGEPSFATPAIAEGVLYLRTASHLFSLANTR